MASRRMSRQFFVVEALEHRLCLNGASPANVIGIATGSVTRPHQVSRTSAHVAPANITPQKHSTIFGLFIRPSSSSSLDPRIVAAAGAAGQPLPVRHGRPFRPGVSGQAVAFAKDRTPGLLSTDVTGRSQTTGTYQAETTLVGDINGDGKVNLADLQAFAPSYMSHIGQPNYNPAADFNQNGFINIYDAKALMRNMTPLTPRMPLRVKLTLAPQDQIHYSGPTISGAATFQKNVTILGRTTPGSLVIEDNRTSRLPGGTETYKFTGPAVATNAQGYFSINTTNTTGLNNNDLLILDPFGQHLIVDFTIFWIPYATGRGFGKRG
ncbi:MAG: dockerin type I domain-containing protein [Isosphaeraceae bacterium]